MTMYPELTALNRRDGRVFELARHAAQPAGLNDTWSGGLRKQRLLALFNRRPPHSLREPLRLPDSTDPFASHLEAA